MLICKSIKNQGIVKTKDVAVTKKPFKKSWKKDGDVDACPAPQTL